MGLLTVLRGGGQARRASFSLIRSLSRLLSNVSDRIWGNVKFPLLGCSGLEGHPPTEFSRL